jgi:hypothetical protein
LFARRGIGVGNPTRSGREVTPGSRGDVGAKVVRIERSYQLLDRLPEILLPSRGSRPFAAALDSL